METHNNRLRAKIWHSDRRGKKNRHNSTPERLRRRLFAKLKNVTGLICILRCKKNSFHHCCLLCLFVYLKFYYAGKRYGYIFLTPANRRRNNDIRRNSDSSATVVQMERKISSKGGMMNCNYFIL